MQSSKALSLGVSLKIYRNTTQEKMPLVIRFVVSFNFTAGAENAKKLLQEIVILPYLRPEVLYTFVTFAGCPVPIFFYFLSWFLFSPTFQIKPPIFPNFLAD